METAALLPKLPPRVDLVFRRLFDEQDHCRLLISLLNSILKLPTEDLITELTLLPTHVTGPQADDKEVVLDLRAQTLQRRQFQMR